MIGRQPGRGSTVRERHDGAYRVSDAEERSLGSRSEAGRPHPLRAVILFMVATIPRYCW